MTKHTASPPTDDRPNLDRKIDLYDLDVTVDAAIVDPSDHMQARLELAKIIQRNMPGRTLSLRKVAGPIREWAEDQDYTVEFVDINGERIYEREIEATLHFSDE